MHRTLFSSDHYNVSIAPGRDRIRAFAVIKVIDHDYRVRFGRAGRGWQAFTECRGTLVVAAGRTQMIAAKALACLIGRTVYGIDLDAANAAHEAAMALDAIDCGAPTMGEQDWECEQDALARSIDRV